MELAEITAALEGNAELLNGITSFVLDTDKGKEVITNKAESIFQTRISDEISGVHSQYDNDAFDILGEKPKVLDDGKKQKTYDFLKERLTELKTLRGQKDELNVDAQIIKLNEQVEDLKKNGGGAHWEQTFNTEKSKWKTEREELIKKATSAEGNIVNFQKKSDIEAGLRGLKFNDDVPEAARKALVDNVVNNLINKSKIEDGKVIYLDDKGGVINDNEYKPQSAAGILKNSLKDILKNENTDGGGGAPTTITGSIETTKVDGKDDVKRLILQEGSFKTKTEFLAKAEEALLKSGITRTNTKDWDALKNEAYKRYQVGNLPR